MIRFALLFFILTGSSWARLGGGSAGVQICGDQVTLYAFYEGAHPLLHDLPLWTDDPKISATRYLNRALDKMDSLGLTIAKDIREHSKIILKELDNSFVIFPELTNYHDIPMVDAGCEYKHVTLRDSTNRLAFDWDIFQKLSPFGQAGLIFQEALNEIMITTYPESSLKSSNFDNVRRMTAQAFSDATWYSRIDPDSLDEKERTTYLRNRCTSAMQSMTKELELYTKTIQMCSKDKGEDVKAMFKKLLTLLKSSGESCKNTCVEEGSRSKRICESFNDLINQSTPCD